MKGTFVRDLNYIFAMYTFAQVNLTFQLLNTEVCQNNDAYQLSIRRC